MSKKIDRALYGPSFLEVILGAVLSLLLGIALAAVYLIAKPVALVHEIPKEPVKGTVYYIEGSKDTTKGRAWVRKRKVLIGGGSVALTEDELNAAVEVPPDKSKPAAVPVPAAKPPAKPPAPGAPAPVATPAGPPAVPGQLLAVGVPNFRLHDGELQIGVPCTITVPLVGYSQPVTVVAVGGFVKDGDTFVFDPKSFYVGSLLVDRLPGVADFVTKKIMAAQTIPPDLAAAWKKLADVNFDAKTKALVLAMP
jgi:hypothetical protein